MNNRQINIYRIFFVFIDLLALNLVHAVIMVAMNNFPINSERHYLFLFVAANMFWLVASYSMALYVDNATPNVDLFAKRTFRSFIFFNGMMLLFMFIYRYSYSRIFMALSFSAFLGYLILSRMILVGVTFYMQKVGKVTKRIVIVGYNEIAKTLVSRFQSQRKNFQIEGFFEEDSTVNELSLLPIIGRIDECVEYAQTHNIQEIYSTISPENRSGLYEMAKVAEKSFIRFKFVPDFKLYVNRNTHMEYLAEIPILSLRPEPLEDVGNAIQKRAVDIVMSLLVMIFLLSWLVPLMALLIKLNSRGPVFFVQLRSGKNNKQFKCFKFRTLKVNDEAHLKQVTKNDERITKLGRFLRKTNIDELPQFLNVLIGNMSIVGPRPHMLNHTTSFSKIMEEYMIRHFVKPGVTGWAQVNGYRGEIKQTDQLRKRIEYDIWYMENWSLWLDIKIIWLTVYSTIKGDANAY